jgi:hypothetical protein
MELKRLDRILRKVLGILNPDLSKNSEPRQLGEWEEALK